MTKQFKSYADVPVNDDPSLSQNVDVIIEHWQMVLCVTAIVFSLGVSYAFLAPPVYRADAMIQVEDPNGSSVSSPTPWQSKDAAAQFDAAAATAAESELVRSRSVLQPTVKALRLEINVTPKYFPVLGRWLASNERKGELAKPVLGLTGYAWGGEELTIDTFDAAADRLYTLIAGEGGSYVLQNDDNVIVARSAIGQDIAVNDRGDNVSIKVSRLVANPGTKFTIKRLHELDAINRLQDDLKVEQLGKQAGILSVSLDGENNAKITQIVNAIARTYVEQNVAHKSQEAQTTLAFLEEQLPILKGTLERSENAYNSFRNAHSTVDLSEETKLLLGQMVDAQAKQTELEQKRNELTQRFSEEFPAVASLTQSIDELKTQQRKFASRVAVLPSTEQNALRLLRDVRVNTGLYTNMLNSAQQLDIVRAGQMGNVRVVDWAMTSSKPVKPRKTVVIGVSLILGLALGLGMPFVRRRFRPGIEHSEHFERYLHAPVYSVVPHSEKQAKLDSWLRRGMRGRHLLATQAPDDIAVEAIRSLQAALHFDAFGASNNIILLTGPRPDVGKSFLAANLAKVLAASGKHVLLVDADMRGGDIDMYFGVKSEPGLSDAIGGEATERLIHRGAGGSNLDFLPKGSKPENPTELLMSDRFKTLLDDFSAHYDMVVIDAPPLLPVVDAAVIARYAGTTLMAVRYGRHTTAEIAEAERRLQNANVEVSGVLVNDVPQRSVGYGSYYRG
ncbi:exopolysaccharide transport protein family protein [Caballeronia choica]|uniref:Putative tyrosine-protein kinase EpsB n=1 Tax=Caballeronia choica TaxID=326476 RepID=A0A158KTQ3_9BURK|nr:polysaccharide biosynthesis tyrosine autokinase [Caballeronia choica]SAL83801.1 exopolysaccharide transport protein family protein [Caballeronia choica]